jgi:hypothetical protein
MIDGFEKCMAIGHRAEDDVRCGDPSSDMIRKSCVSPPGKACWGRLTKHFEMTNS